MKSDLARAQDIQRSTNRRVRLTLALAFFVLAVVLIDRLVSFL